MRYIRYIGLIVLLAFSILFSAAGFADSKNEVVDSSKLLPMSNPNPVGGTAVLTYVTFKTSNLAAPMLGQCPKGLTLLPGSVTNVPAIPGVPEFQYPQKYWQCVQSVHGFAKSVAYEEIQPYQNMDYPNYNPSLATSLNNPGTVPEWLKYSNDVYYTYFNFPGNQFIPTGIGGSAITCPNAGGYVSIHCTNGLGQVIYDRTVAPTLIPVIFYIGPSDKANCRVKRSYSDPSNQCDVPPNITIDSGQAKVMSCCWKQWACSTGAWDNPMLLGCGDCPCHNPNQGKNHSDCPVCQ